MRHPRSPAEALGTGLVGALQESLCLGPEGPTLR